MMTRSFSISEAATQAGMSVDALRYYERAGLMLVPLNVLRPGTVATASGTSGGWCS